MSKRSYNISQVYRASLLKIKLKSNLNLTVVSNVIKNINDKKINDTMMICGYKTLFLKYTIESFSLEKNEALFEFSCDSRVKLSSEIILLND